nr:MAG TPA: hypothetical protein [Caudoviricetes sp.]
MDFIDTTPNSYGGAPHLNNLSPRLQEISLYTFYPLTHNTFSTDKSPEDIPRGICPSYFLFLI